MGKKKALFILLLGVLFLNSSFVYGSIGKRIQVNQTNQTSQVAFINQSMEEYDEQIMDGYETKLACKEDLNVNRERLSGIAISESSSITDNINQSDKSEEEELTNEVISERTEHSKTFEISEDQYKFVSTVESQHYLKNGEWEDINTSFKLNEKSQIVMDENRFCVTVNNNSNSVNLTIADSTIKYVPVDANVAEVITDENKVTFIDLWNDIDLVYIVNNDVLKMDIKLKSSSTPSQFKLKLNMENLHAKVDEFDNVLLVDQYEQTLMVLPKMNEHETLGNSILLDEFSYYLATENNETYLVFNVNHNDRLTYPLSLSSFVTEVEGISSNKLYHNLPNVSTDKIQSISFQNESHINDWDWSAFDRPMDVYFMREEVNDFGCNYGRGCSPYLEPGSDGRSAAFLGTTANYDETYNSITLSKAEIQQLVGTIDIYGGVFYHERNPDEDIDHITSIEMIYEETQPIPQKQIQYFYDANNRLDYIIMNTGQRVNYIYDKKGSLKEKIIVSTP